ncbi:MAG: hypothetical protein ACI87V_001203 [Flavobacteriales bacterium]
MEKADNISVSVMLTARILLARRLGLGKAETFETVESFINCKSLLFRVKSCWR